MKTWKKLTAIAILMLLMLSLSAMAAEPVQAGAAGAISVGDGFSAAVRSDGTLWTWGGQKVRWDGLVEPSTVPVKRMEDVRAVACGDSTMAVIKHDGSLWMWGVNNWGQLGIGSQTNSAVPVKVMDNVRDVCLSGTYTMAIREDNSLWLWGKPDDFYIVFGATSVEEPSVIGKGKYYLEPQRVMENVASVKTGGTTIGGNRAAIAFIKTDGSLWAWGYQAPWKMPQGSSNQIPWAWTPVKLMDGVRSVHLDETGTFALVVKADNTLWNWGPLPITEKEINPEDTVVATEVPYKLMDGVASACVSTENIAIIKTDGTLWMCGRNQYGSIGNGNVGGNVVIQKAVKVLDNVVDVALGRSLLSANMALTADGAVWAWGFNTFGAVGNNSQGTKVESAGMTTALNGENTFHEGILQLDPTKIMPGVESPVLSTPSSWAKANVDAAIGMGIVPENMQSSYTQPVTRAEYCALATALYESVNGEITQRSGFSDTTDINVEKMAALGVANGVGGGRIAPDMQLTREQAATMLARLAEAMGHPIPVQEMTFSDAENVSSWAKAAVGQMQQSGIMSGVGDNRFSPDREYTREQSIITMLRMFNYVKA